TNAQIQTVKGFYFVGNVAEKAGLLYYNFAQENIDTIWYNKNEMVQQYAPSETGNTGFFITATETAKKGVFPRIKDICLYFVDEINNRVSKVKNFGSGLQFYAYWQDTASVKIIINTIDATTASYVEQKAVIIAVDGKVLFEDSKKYDLTTEGYPRMPQENVQLVSSISGASIIAGAKNEISIKLHSGTREEISGSSSNRLQQVAWSVDGKYAVIVSTFIHPDNTTLYENKPETAKLYIYDLLNKKLLNTFSGGGYKNVRLINQFVIFDDGFGEKSVIKILQPGSKSAAKEINLKGGCGMKNIPALPDYEA
ncbi:MAG: hypothetical protein HY965_01805, partial [Ignavibacteriales bacterium]|nr:hypothetical protein [Ignavibacteriales bacterium]